MSRWLVVPAVLAAAGAAAAQAPSGAIFTTLSDGSEVNLNQFPSKEAVYLDGGPGPGAPQSAAGLDDGTYVFMVTDPSGQTLLSTDPARCRLFTVSGGIITGVVDTGCQHATGFDIDHGAVTVQLFPYDDTPNPGGVYKVWVTPLENFPDACLATVDCLVPGTKHGFLPRYSKTDNFKVVGENVREIDTFFFRDRDGDGRWDGWDEKVLGGVLEIWTDTNGVENPRWSDPSFYWGVLAHVEVPESDMGAHYIAIPNQQGCRVTGVRVNGGEPVFDAWGRIVVDVGLNIDYYIEVGCAKSRR